MSAMLAVLYFLGFLTIGKRRRGNKIGDEVGFIYSQVCGRPDRLLKI